MQRPRLALLLITVAAIAAFHTGQLVADDGQDPIARWGAQLLKIAADYKTYKRPDDQIRIAPTQCFVPATKMNGGLRGSKAKDGGHARKLYYLFVKDIEGYKSMAKSKAAPVGQTIVKEAWIPTKIEKGSTVRFGARAHMNGAYYTTGKKKALFVMLKVKAGTPGTDAGWVYGTVSPDGKQVTSAGKISSCAGCHMSAPHDRQYGLPTLNAMATGK